MMKGLKSLNREICGAHSFWHWGLVSGKLSFPWIGGHDDLGMTQVHYIYCALYFYYYYTVVHDGKNYTAHHNVESVGTRACFPELRW